MPTIEIATRNKFSPFLTGMITETAGRGTLEAVGMPLNNNPNKDTGPKAVPKYIFYHSALKNYFREILASKSMIRYATAVMTGRRIKTEFKSSPKIISIPPIELLPIR
jgi:hypothetical protein